MATNTVKRVYQIDVTTTPEARRAVTEIQKRMRSIETNSERAAKSLRKVERSFNFAALAAKAYVAVRVVSYIQEMSDAMTLLEARVKVVTDGTLALETAMQDLYAVSVTTRSSIDATADLYVRLAQAAKGTAITHEDLIKVVTGISNALLLSGTSSQEAKALTVQLGQAFAKGKLDGDEFRSVMENSAIAGQLLADALGVTRGELFKLSKEGKITREVMNEAFGDGAGGLKQLVEDMPVTFDQAFTAMGNVTKQFVTTFKDEMSAVAGAIKGVADSWTAALKKISDNSRDAVNLVQGDNQGNAAQLATLRKLIEEEEQSFVLPGQTNQVLEGYKRQYAALLQVAAASKDAANSTALLQEEQKKLDQAIRSNTFVESYLEGTEPSEEKSRERVRAIKEIVTWQERYRQSVIDVQIDQDRFSERLKILDDLYFDGVIGLELYEAELEKLTGTLGESTVPAVEEFSDAMKNAIAQSAVDSIGDMTDALVDFAVTGKQSFAELTSSILSDISKMILRMVVLNSLKSAFGGTPFGNFLFPTGTPSFATGTPYVPQDGLAYLHKGERVVPASQNTVTNNNNYTTERPISIVNVTDPGQIGEIMGGSVGEEVVINHIRRNPDLIRQVLS